MKETKPADKIILYNTSFLKNKFNPDVNEINKKLPNMYWNPKLHKNPTKARLIIAAPKYLEKPLSKVVIVALKLIYKQIENYNFKTLYHCGVKTFWRVQSNQNVISTINKLNSRNKAISGSTFGFFTLYTNIPHHKLKSVMEKFVKFFFNGGDKEFIRIT